MLTRYDDRRPWRGWWSRTVQSAFTAWLTSGEASVVSAGTRSSGHSLAAASTPTLGASGISSKRPRRENLARRRAESPRAPLLRQMRRVSLSKDTGAATDTALDAW